MAQATPSQQTYPWTTTMGDHELTFRLMQPSDRDAVLVFARALPSEDLMFLRTDITQEKTVDNWMSYIKSGRTLTLLAEAKSNIAGYASIHTSDALWTRHIGELRVLVSLDHRGIGLGKRLTNEAFAIAKDLSDNFAMEAVITVNVNEADAETIADTLLGVGFKRAQAIVDYREQHGRFYSAEELTAVKGIGQSTVEKNLSRITIK